MFYKYDLVLVRDSRFELEIRDLATFLLESGVEQGLGGGFGGIWDYFCALTYDFYFMGVNFNFTFYHE